MSNNSAYLLQLYFSKKNFILISNNYHLNIQSALDCDIISIFSDYLKSQNQKQPTPGQAFYTVKYFNLEPSPLSANILFVIAHWRDAILQPQLTRIPDGWLTRIPDTQAVYIQKSIVEIIHDHQTIRNLMKTSLNSYNLRQLN